MTPNTPMTELPVDLADTFAPTMPDNWPAVLESRAAAAYLRDTKGTVDLLRATAVYLRQQALSQSLRAPAGELVAVPQKMRMDGNALKAITFMLASADDDDDTPTDAVLWVGDLMDDDGKPVHGLHLANSEYPEEGSVTLVEFPAASPPSEGVKVTDEMVERGKAKWRELVSVNDEEDPDERLDRVLRAALEAALQSQEPK